MSVKMRRAFLVVLLCLLFLGPHNLAKSSYGLEYSVSVDKPVYAPDELVRIAGTFPEGTVVNIVVLTPQENIAWLDQVMVGEEGRYESIFRLDPKAVEGKYKVIVIAGERRVEAFFRVSMSPIENPRDLVPDEEPREKEQPEQPKGPVSPEVAIMASLAILVGSIVAYIYLRRR